MRNKTLLFIALLIIGCNKKEATPTYPLSIPIEKMTAIMIDLTVAEAGVLNYKLRYRDSVKNVYRYHIEEIHDIEMSVIDSNLSLLYQSPYWNKQVQKAVFDSIKSIEKAIPRTKKKR